jgi:hypothetical protein
MFFILPFKLHITKDVCPFTSCLASYPPFFSRHPVDLSSGVHLVLFYILGFPPIILKSVQITPLPHTPFCNHTTLFPSCLRRLTKLVGIHQITTYWVILGVLLGLPYLFCGHQRILFFCFSWLTGFVIPPAPYLFLGARLGRCFVRSANAKSFLNLATIGGPYFVLG